MRLDGCFIVLVLVFVFAVAVKDVVHEAVVYTSSSADYLAMRAADKPSIWELARTFLVVTAAGAEGDQPLGQGGSAPGPGTTQEAWIQLFGRV